MTASPPGERVSTHAVFDEPPPFEDVDLVDADLALREGLGARGRRLGDQPGRCFGTPPRAVDGAAIVARSPPGAAAAAARVLRG